MFNRGSETSFHRPAIGAGLVVLIHGLRPISANVARQTVRFLHGGDFEGPLS